MVEFIYVAKREVPNVTLQVFTLVGGLNIYVTEPTLDTIDIIIVIVNTSRFLDELPRQIICYIICVVDFDAIGNGQQLQFIIFNRVAGVGQRKLHK